MIEKRIFDLMVFSKLSLDDEKKTNIQFLWLFIFIFLDCKPICVLQKFLIILIFVKT